MLIATQSQSIAGTQKYFDTVLSRGDYYLGQEVAGCWHGLGAELLGLGEGASVTKGQFAALLAGDHPLTGRRLAQRARRDRRPGVDLTFSVPKSVSLAWAVLDDQRVEAALREAVLETMRHDVEPLMHRRVRQGGHAGSKESAPTQKLIYADFLHKTSRPVDGRADPHLHIHAFVMNWTEEQGRHYAGEFEEIIRQRACLQAKFDARLARKLEQLGYGVEQVRFLQGGRLKRGWEIKGVGRSTIEKFSRRTAQVEEQAQQLGVTDAAHKGRLGKLTREKKDEGRSMEELRREWRARLTPEEHAAFEKLRTASPPEHARPACERAAESVRHALDHHLYRGSTVERHVLVGAALEHGLTLRAKDVEQAIEAMGLIERRVVVNGAERRLVTTRSVLEAERAMIAYARDGRGSRRAISTAEHRFSREWLNDHQRDAVRHVLRSRDAVVAVVGGAGTGKTSLMQEAVEAIGRHGKRVFTFAPSTGAREVLQDKGFASAQTVEHLIRNTSLHPKLKDQVLWIDEAGLLDVRSMNRVFAIAKEQNARVVLSGDTRQHATPRRGEAMRLLQREAGIKPARSEHILRQQGRYRQAVAMISRGYEVVDRSSGKTGLLAGFDMLDKLGKVRELPAEERHAQLADTYLTAADKGKSTLVVAPTHGEARAVTDEIRGRLQQRGQLSTDERAVPQYRSLNLSDAEKREPSVYANQPGVVVQFHQNAAGGITRGDRFRVAGVADGQVRLEPQGGGLPRLLPLEAASRFEVYEQRELRLAPGDKLRFCLGGVARGGKGRLSNGRLDELKGFDKRGNLVLKNGWVVDKDYAHLDLGYVVTSHASQGKDRQVAIAAMGSASLPAINAKQFYVTVSRGSEDVVLFVDNKAKVRQAIQRSGEQLSATEMMIPTRRPVAASQQRRLTRDKRRHAGAFRDRLLRCWRALGGGRTAAAGTRPGPSTWGPALTPTLERSRA